MLSGYWLERQRCFDLVPPMHAMVLLLFCYPVFPLFSLSLICLVMELSGSKLDNLIVVSSSR
ncbi:hypothetical protein M440DRAFT_1010006 [Trichoderma longibrachiatum ATCC 18648]|uniref:Uncharacterized protein n=1 Tax=Trichoderma longibrachiatum ATCC 18648 TaxID=983965 RepID=A0A2T4CI05_TRILO|nr:hypothetical protein M440DRAFT_1010006 [Trichoderma longibrachiatum ATCC 18648]